jgi:hypothetical protein
MRDVDLQQLLKGLEIKSPFPVSGQLTFRVQATLPLETPGDWKAYRLDGTATLTRVKLAEWKLDHLHGRIVYAGGVLRVEQLRGAFPDPYRPEVGPPAAGTFTGSGRLQLFPEGDLSARLTLDRLALEELLAAVPGLRGTATGTLSGEAQLRVPARKLADPTAWRGSGTVTARRLHVQGRSLGDVSATVRAGVEQGRLQLADLQAALYGGKVTGTVDVPLRADQPGRVRLQFADVDLGALVRDLPEVPVRVEGRAGGKIDGTLPPPAAGQPRSFEATVELAAPSLRVRNVPAERLTGTVSYRQGVWEYHLKGEVFGGKFDIDGRIPAEKPVPPPGGKLQIDGARLGPLWEWLGLREPLGRLSGEVTLRVEFAHGPGAPTARGTFAVTRLRWDQRDLGGVRGRLALAGSELRLQDISGTLGEGSLRGQVVLSLEEVNRSWFDLTLDRVEASRLLAPWPLLASSIQAPVDARVRGWLGQEWRGSAEVRVTRGKVRDVEVADWRLPVGFTYVPARSRGELNVTETSAQLARGRVTGHARLAVGAAPRLEGQLRFNGLDLEILARQALALSSAGAGQLTGRIDFGGSDLRSLDDVTAVVDASLRQTQAFQLPVLAALVPYIAPGQAHATFHSGELHGRLSGGVFRISKFTLSGAVVSLVGAGTMTPQGRINLNVTATTGRVGINPRVLRVFGLRLPPVGPIPAALIVQVTDYLSNRVVHLHVSGTVRHPTVRVEPLPLLTDEAVRFFLNRYNVPLP